MKLALKSLAAKGKKMSVLDFIFQNFGKEIYANPKQKRVAWVLEQGAAHQYQLQSFLLKSTVMLFKWIILVFIPTKD